MTNGTDRIAGSRVEGSTGGSLARVRIAAVEEHPEAVDVVLELPSCDRFTHTLQKPPVWGSNCALATVLEAFDLDHTNLKGLIDERVPCTRSVEDGSLELEIDVDALREERSSRAVTPDGFGSLEL